VEKAWSRGFPRHMHSARAFRILLSAFGNSAFYWNLYDRLRHIILILANISDVCRIRTKIINTTINQNLNPTKFTTTTSWFQTLVSLLQFEISKQVNALEYKKEMQLSQSNRVTLHLNDVMHKITQNVFKFYFTIT